MIEWKTILVAVDLRDEASVEAAQSTVRQALSLSDSPGTRVTLLHVIEADDATKARMLSEEPSSSREMYLQVKEQLTGLLKDAPEHAVVETAVTFGKTWVSIIEEVVKLNPDVLIAGPAHRGPVAEALFGSTTLKLIRKAPCPVWVVKPETKSGGTLLVAHDLSEVGEKALAWGVELCRRDKLDLHILHCLDPAEHFGFWSSTSSEVLEGEKSARRARIEQSLQALEQEAEITIEVGSPQVQVYNYLQKCPPVLLLMGTAGRTGVSGVVVGNTAEALLPWIRCSLLALKPAFSEIR